MSSPPISVIVPTRNRSHLLARLLASLARLQYDPWEVIVVDDGSTDDTAAVVARFRDDGLPVTYLYQPWSRMGAARNLGIAQARGEILAFTDDDCLVHPAWLQVIAATFDRIQDALGVQGKTVTEREAMTPFTRQVEQLESGAPYRTCNIAYRSGVLRDLGGFDPQLIRGEDVVMAMRVLELGPIAWAPDALVVHPPRPKEWADRRAWRTLMESELHFRRTYARYAPARSPTLSVQKPEHVLSRWLILPVRRYWRWHYAYFRRAPREYLRYLPLIVKEKAALFSLLPFFLGEWRRPAASGPISAEGAREGGGEWPPISVVVPTRNRAPLLPGLLAALDRQRYPSFEVIVVDDASSDDTPEVLARWARAGKTVVRQEVPGGSYAARNRGWRSATAEIVAFTDDDCLPETDWLRGLASAFQADTAGVQGKTVTDRAAVTPFTHQIEALRPGPPYRTCNMAYRRSVLEQLGGFDDRLRWYADNILGFRARGIGAIGWAPQAVVHHPPRRREWRDRSIWRARMRADALHRQELQRLEAEPALMPRRALPLVLWILRPLLKQSIRHLRYALLHPIRYAREVRPMVGEKVDLLRAMRDFWAEGTGPGGARDGKPALPPLGGEPLVSVLVVTRDRPELLEGALEAIDAQTWMRRETLVVDHGEDLRTREIACRHGARYIPAPDPTLGSARQRGVEAARGEVVAFTDDDCRPQGGWLAALVQALQQPGSVGAQGRTEAESGAIGSHAVRVTGQDELYQTCNIAYRADVLERAGGFDAGFAGHFEDTALAARVLHWGEIAFAPGAIVCHQALPRHPRTREGWRQVLEDERRLANTYPAFYRRVRGPGFLVTVLARWLLGSPLKTLARDLPRAGSDPSAYLSLAGSLVRERMALLLALWDVLGGRNTR